MLLLLLLLLLLLRTKTTTTSSTASSPRQGASRQGARPGARGVQVQVHVQLGTKSIRMQNADRRRTTLKCSNLGGIHLVMGRCAESNVKRCFSEPYFAWSPLQYICLMKFSLHSSTAFHFRFQTAQ